MNSLAAGFWGAFFGTAALMFGVSMAAYLRARRRVALLAALSAIVSASFVVAYLGWLPLEGKLEARVLAHVAILAAAILSPMMLSLLGLMRERAEARRVFGAFGMLALVVIAVGWLLDAPEALMLSWLTAFSAGAVMLVVALRSAAGGNRFGRATVAGMSLLLLSLAGLSWIALDRSAAWPVHAVSALAAMGFL